MPKEQMPLNPKPEKPEEKQRILPIKPGERVRVKREDGTIEDNWEFAAYDPEGDRVVVIKLEIEKEAILHKNIPWEEFSQLNPIARLEPWTEVSVKRSSGLVESGWRFVKRTASNEALVVKPPDKEERSGLMKYVTWEKFVEANRDLLGLKEKKKKTRKKSPETE